MQFWSNYKKHQRDLEYLSDGISTYWGEAWPRIKHKKSHYVTNREQRNDRLLQEKSKRKAQSWDWQPFQTVSLEEKDITDLFIFIPLPLIFNFGSLSIDGIFRAYIIILAALSGGGISFLTPIQYDLGSWSFTLSSQKQNRGRIYCITDVKLHPHNALFMAWINVFRWSWVGSKQVEAALMLNVLAHGALPAPVIPQGSGWSGSQPDI